MAVEWAVVGTDFFFTAPTPPGKRSAGVVRKKPVGWFWCRVGTFPLHERRLAQSFQLLNSHPYFTTR